MNDHTVWRQIAEHEAAHAVIAMRMGLAVEWAQITPGEAEGIHFGAAVSIPDHTLDMERDLLAVCVSMAAPSFIDWHRGTALGRYAEIEANIAYEIGGRGGITWDEIHDKCSDLMDEHWPEVVDLSIRLMEEGRVVFQTI